MTFGSQNARVTEFQVSAMTYILIHHAVQCTKRSFHLKMNKNLNLVLKGSCNSIYRENGGYL